MAGVNLFRTMGIRGFDVNGGFSHVGPAVQPGAKFGIDGYASRPCYMDNGGSTGAGGVSANQFDLRSPNPTTGRSNFNVLVMDVIPLMNLKEFRTAAWAASGQAALAKHFDAIKAQLDAIRAQANPDELARIAPAIHDGTYWTEKSSGPSISDQAASPNSIKLGLTLAPGIPDAELGKYLKPAALAAYRARYANASFSYRMKLGDLIEDPDLRLEFFHHQGKTGVQREDVWISPMTARDNKHIENGVGSTEDNIARIIASHQQRIKQLEDQQIINVNWGSWNQMAADAVYFAPKPDGKTRLAAMAENQTTAYARVKFILSLLQHPKFDKKDIALLHHVLWMVTGHYAGKDKAWSVDFVRAAWADIPDDIKAIDINMFRDISKLIAAEGK